MENLIVSLALALASLMMLAALVLAADPDPIQDFCLPVSSSNQECQDPSKASGVEFSSSILRNKTSLGPLPPLGFNATLVTASVFPALNTMGLAFARADLGEGGVVPAHVHPRASELVYIEKGTVEAGFVGSNNVLYSQTLEAGDMLIVPRGLLHYQYNVGKGGATIYATFNSQDPGVAITGPNLFGSGLPDAVVAASLQIDENTIQALKQKFKPSH